MTAFAKGLATVAVEALKKAPKLVKPLTQEASSAAQKLRGIFDDAVKNASKAAEVTADTASATLTNSTINVNKAVKDSKAFYDSISALRPHLDDEQWKVLDMLWGATQKGNTALGADDLKTFQSFFTQLGEEQVAVAGHIAHAIPPEEEVISNVVGILEETVTNKSGHFYNLSRLANTFGVKGMPTPDQLPKYLSDKIITRDFKDCLRACIQGKEPPEGLLKSFWQKQAFNMSRKLIDTARNNPELILEKGPQAAYWLQHSSGPIMSFLHRVPFIGGALAYLYPLVPSAVGATGSKTVGGNIRNIIRVFEENAARASRISEAGGKAAA